MKYVADQRPTRPWFAIGGVTLGRLDDALAAGAIRGSSFTQAQKPTIPPPRHER